MKELEITADKQQLEMIAQTILKEAAKKGADQAAVGIATNKGFSVTAREGDVETVEYHQDKSIEIQVYFNQRVGASSISDFRPAAIKDAVEAACHIAKFTDKDPAAGLAEVSELAFGYPELELAFPADLSVEQAIALACQCEREAFKYDTRIISAEGASVATSEAFFLYANSQGFMGSYPFTNHEISCVLVAKEKEEMQRDLSYTAATNYSKLRSVSEIAKEAAERTVNRLGARRIATTKSPVIFLAEEARGLIGHFAAAISGSNIYRQSSFLLHHLDKQIFPKFMHIQEHPHLLYGMGSVPFDNDGVATRSNIFIEAGILKSYYLNVYSARKLNMKTTGNSGGTHNLTVQSGSLNLSQLLKEMGTGLLVTELMGQGVNLITGDYSRGASGYWVENGEIIYPVQEVTIAGNLKEIFQRISAIGNDVDQRGNVRTGSILIEEMMIAGN